MPKPNHAVILVNYNGLNNSLDCIRSILNSESQDRIKIIFVDNASTMDEGMVVKERYPNIHLIKSNINAGYSAGNNLGIKYALNSGYEYITLLNNDTVVASDMFTYLEKYCSEKMVVAPKMYYYSRPNVIWYGGGEINRRTGNAEHIHMNCEDIYDQVPRKCTFATGCCLMANANTFRKVGLLDEEYFMYCEDSDFCMRLMQADVSIEYVPEAELWHKVSSSTGGSNSPFSTYYLTRNRLNYVKKYRDYFGIRGYLFTFISRVIRMINCKDNSIRAAFYNGIKDHLRNIKGRAEAY